MCFRVAAGADNGRPAAVGDPNGGFEAHGDRVALQVAGRQAHQSYRAAGGKAA